MFLGSHRPVNVNHFRDRSSETISPVPGTPMPMCHSKDLDRKRKFSIDNGKWESSQNEFASAVIACRPAMRGLGDSREGAAEI